MEHPKPHIFYIRSRDFDRKIDEAKNYITQSLSSLYPSLELGSTVNEFWYYLRDGILLCELINSQTRYPTCRPAALTPLGQRRQRLQNFSSFLEGCRKLGVHPNDQCSVSDFIEGKLNEILETILALQRVTNTANKCYAHIYTENSATKDQTRSELIMSTSASSQILDKYSTPPRYIFAATPLHDIKHSCENGSVDSKFMNDVNSTSAIGVKKTNSIIGSAIKELGEDTSNEIEKLQQEKQDLQYVIQMLREKLESAEKSRDEHSQQIDKLQVTLVSARHTISTLKSELSKMNEKTNTVQQDNDIDIMRSSHTKELEGVKSDMNKRITIIKRQGASILQRVRSDLLSISGMAEQLKRDIHSSFASTAQDFTALGDILLHSVQLANDQHKQTVIRYNRAEAERKKYFNRVLELQGNIRVFCRVRPPNKIEMENEDPIAVTCPSTLGSELVIRQRGRTKNYEFDRVFGPESSQGQVFEDVQPTIVSALDGYHTCIFAYGQTGAGKTYTMEGNNTEESRGVNFRALEELFRQIEERRGTYIYDMAVSMVEIYNEQVRDLLCLDSESRLDIRQNLEGVYVPGLTQEKISNIEQVHELVKMGRRNRSTSSTKMNEQSSRSHRCRNQLKICARKFSELLMKKRILSFNPLFEFLQQTKKSLLFVDLCGQNIVNQSTLHGRLILVDLAGSERVSKSEATGDRLKEAQNINKSLSALGSVISSLKSRSQHIPYRNSKLTYLLQDSLGPDAKTLMFVQLSPTESNASETLSSLEFATRVRSVELGTAKRHIESGDATKMKQLAQLLKQKETEVEALQQELLECKNAMNSQEKTLHQKEAELRIHERSLERQKKKNEQLSAALRSKKRSRDSEIDDDVSSGQPKKKTHCLQEQRDMNKDGIHRLIESEEPDPSEEDTENSMNWENAQVSTSELKLTRANTWTGDSRATKKRVTFADDFAITEPFVVNEVDYEKNAIDKAAEVRNRAKSSQGPVRTPSRDTRKSMLSSGASRVPQPQKTMTPASRVLNSRWRI